MKSVVLNSINKDAFVKLVTNNHEFKMSIKKLFNNFMGKLRSTNFDKQHRTWQKNPRYASTPNSKLIPFHANFTWIQYLINVMHDLGKRTLFAQIFGWAWYNLLSLEWLPWVQGPKQPCSRGWPRIYWLYLLCDMYWSIKYTWSHPWMKTAICIIFCNTAFI